MSKNKNNRPVIIMLLDLLKPKIFVSGSSSFRRLGGEKGLLKKNILIINFFIALIFACQTNSKTNIEEKKILESSTENSSFQRGNGSQKWMRVLNTNLDLLPSIYTKDAIKINAKGKLFNGQKEILQSFKTNKYKPDSIYTISNIKANETYEYEIGAFRTTDNKQYKHLLIWKKEDQEKRRELELIVEAKNLTNTNILAQIEKQRKEWIYICNQHNAKNLVSELYAENAIYYNHKPAIIGKEDITKEYQYMNDKNYKLSLRPIHVEVVKDDLVFEIGQCSGSYKGKYILVWQKNETEQWHILMDSNI